MNGFDQCKVHLPSLPEPFPATNQIAELLEIKQNNIILDQGAYLGLISLLFARYSNGRTTITAELTLKY
jgi:hypothetical protein